MPPRPIFPKKVTKKNLKARELVAIEWWQEKLGDVKGKITGQKIINRLGEDVVLRPGQFILFRYLAKWRHDLKKLPYWDQFPLAVVLEVGKTKSGDLYILSLNLHYLPIELRHLAFQRIRELVKTDNPRKNSRAAITYAVFKSMSKLKICQPALKMHLLKQMRSKIVRITWNEMSEFAIYLPDVERWMVGTKHNPNIQKKVYRDSRKMAKEAEGTSSKRGKKKASSKTSKKDEKAVVNKKEKQQRKEDTVQKNKSTYKTRRQRQKEMQKPKLGERWKQRQAARRAARRARRRRK